MLLGNTSITLNQQIHIFIRIFVTAKPNGTHDPTTHLAQIETQTRAQKQDDIKRNINLQSVQNNFNYITAPQASTNSPLIPVLLFSHWKKTPSSSISNKRIPERITIQRITHQKVSITESTLLSFAPLSAHSLDL